MKSSQKLRKMLKTRRLYLDGGTGTVLQSMGLCPGTPPETWNLTNKEKVENLHLSYLRAGSDIIVTNTFGVNCVKYGNYEELITSAVKIAKSARKRFFAEGGSGDKFVALDIGPTGRMLSPLGDLGFEDAVEIFAKNVRVGAKLGADLIFIETMNDAYETKAAILAAKENSDLPIFVSNVYDEQGKLMTGASPEAMVALLEGLSVDAIGANCSLGPDKLLSIAERLCRVSSTPIIIKPNAGLPRVLDGENLFDVDKDSFAECMAKMAELGVSVLGGCCGTTPEYISETVRRTKDVPYSYPNKKKRCVISSYTHALEIGKTPILVGERINPTGKKKLKEALLSDDVAFVLSEGIKEEDAGAQALDVNVGLPGINEAEMMKKVISELQSVTNLPLQIDSGNAQALENAMRIYNGKPLVNSVNGKEASMNSVFPLVKKYGGVVIALTMDEGGIPDGSEGRVRIAKKILAEAKKYGIGRQDIIFDPLAMAVSSDVMASSVTLQTVKKLHDMGYYTSLGVSNVSFGLPARDKINSTFFSLALSMGLDMAIMNPHSVAMMDVYYSFCALTGKDDGFQKYIAYAEESLDENTSVIKSASVDKSCEKGLRQAIIRGLKGNIAEEAMALLENSSPLDIINNEIVPALSEIGNAFECGKAYLPELLMSAESAKHAFEIIKERTPKTESDQRKRVIMATVKGDIHDIGKNIVKLLLESYGFSVIDLGRDVSSREVLECAVKTGIRFVGLSALMTTTVPAMEETISLLHKELPDCKIMVGGAVLTDDYAKQIGADFYANDAMGAVKIAKAMFS